MSYPDDSRTKTPKSSSPEPNPPLSIRPRPSDSFEQSHDLSAPRPLHSDFRPISPVGRAAPMASPITSDSAIQCREFLNTSGDLLCTQTKPLLEKLCQRMERMIPERQESELFFVSDPSHREFIRAETILKQSSEHFKLLALFKVRHPTWEGIFNQQAYWLSQDRGIEIKSTQLYSQWIQAPGEPGNHECKTIRALLTPEKQNSLLGKGYYFSETPLKANDDAALAARGNIETIRCMGEYDVTLGNICDFGVGHFDRELKKAPLGFDSIQSFIKRAYTYVVYREEQLIARSIFIYTFNGGPSELEPPTNIPPTASGPVYFISPNLSDFLFKIKARAKGKGDAVADLVKEEIDQVLTGKISAEIFVKNLETYLDAESPAGLLTKLQSELTKSGITAKPPH